MKKMSKPPNTIKDRWNAAHYTQVKVSVVPDIAAAFKAACADSGASMASVLSKFMVDYSQTTLKSQVMAVNKPFDTRLKRRKAIKNIITQLEQLISDEENYRDNIPENLQNSMRYDTAEQSIERMNEAICLLDEAY